MVKNKIRPGVDSVKSHLSRLRLSRPLAEFWLERYKFNRTELGLDEKKAIVYADRTVSALRETESELAAS